MEPSQESRKRLELSPLDVLLNQPLIDAAGARFLNMATVTNDAQTYAARFNEVTLVLEEAIDYVQRHPFHKPEIASYRSRDSFLLAFCPDANALPVNQLQARLELEGQKQPAFLSVRTELLRAQQMYQTAVQAFQTLVAG